MAPVLFRRAGGYKKPSLDTSLHGPWDKGVKSAEKKFTVPAGASQCTVSWRSWGIGTRDGEADRVLMNDKEVWSSTVTTSSGCTGDWKLYVNRIRVRTQ